MIVIKDPNAKEKPTTLKDDASIYQKREAKTERQKFSEMKTWAERRSYFRTYYLKPTIAGIGIFVLAVCFLSTIFSPRDRCLLRVAFVDYPLSQETTDEIQASFLQASEITLNKHEMIDFDGTTYQPKMYGYNAQSVLATHIMAKELDVFVAPESVFLSHAKNGTLGSLTTLLPSDIYSALSSRFFLASPAGEEEEDECVFGIYLDGSPFWDQYSSLLDATERPIIGIVANSRNKEMAAECIRYLFGLSSR